MPDDADKPGKAPMPAFATLLMHGNPLVSEAQAREIAALASARHAREAREEAKPAIREDVFAKVPPMPAGAWPEAAPTRH